MADHHTGKYSVCAIRYGADVYSFLVEPKIEWMLKGNIDQHKITDFLLSEFFRDCLCDLQRDCSSLRKYLQFIKPLTNQDFTDLRFALRGLAKTIIKQKGGFVFAWTETWNSQTQSFGPPESRIAGYPSDFRSACNLPYVKRSRNR
jgi:hypothetical protein